MTDTEAKALALVNEVFMERCLNLATYTNRVKNVYHEVICRVIERLEATEARHAAELREQAERFSEVAKEAHESLDGYSDFSPAGHARKILAPFVLTKPDPLVEAWVEAWPVTPVPLAQKYAAKYSATLAARGYKVRKIGEG